MNKILLIFLISLLSLLFSLEYTDNGFEIFLISGDATTHSLGGSPNIESMSLSNLYTLNNSHKRGQSLFSYGNLFSGIINYFQFSYIIKESKKSRIGLSLINKSIKNIPNTQNAWIDLGHNILQGEIDYDQITTYSDQQTSLLFLYSYSFDLIDIGIKIKPLYTSILNNKGYGLSADLGFDKKTNHPFSYGFCIKDIISFYNWDTGRNYAFYPRLSTSGSYIFKDHSVYTEVSISSNFQSLSNSYIYKVGYENKINNRVSIRFGYSSNKSFSFGAGIIYKKIKYTYSFSPNLNDIILGQDHQFGILLNLFEM